MIALIQRQLKTHRPLTLKIRSFLIRQRWSPTQECNLQRLNKQPSVKEIENLAEFGGRWGKESELEIED